MGGKRPREDSSMPRGKRSKRSYATKRRSRTHSLPAKQQFINRMGGWAQNGRSSTGIERVSMISKPLTGTMTFGTNSQSSIALKLVPDSDTWPLQGLKDAFQMIRPKKVTMILTGMSMYDGTTHANQYNLQIIIAKFKDDDIGNTSMAVVPGAQVKMFNVVNNGYIDSRTIPVDGEVEVMQCSVLRPPINVRVEKTATDTTNSGEGVLSGGWVDTAHLKGIAPYYLWNCFGVQVSKVGPFVQRTNQVFLQFFMTCEWECKTRKWTPYGSLNVPTVLSNEEEALIKAHRDSALSVTSK